MQAEILFLALAVSLDGFGVGMACGMRRLSIMLSSLLVICFMSAGAVALSMVLGQIMGVFICPELAPRGGGLILIFLGLYTIFNSLRDMWSSSRVYNSGVQAKKGKDYTRGITGFTNLTRAPEKADRDFSGTLSARETMGLGAALAADAFGAGFGAVLVGLNLFLTVLAVGLTKLLLVPAGFLLGRYFSFSALGNLAPLLSGVMLVVLGVSALI